MKTRLARLNEEALTIRSKVESIEEAATAAGRDLTEDENTAVQTLLGRYDQVQEDIAAEVKREEAQANVQNVLARVHQEPAAQAQELTPGEYVHRMLQVQKGLITPEQFRAETALYRAQQTTADGYLPSQLVGDLLAPFDASTPVWSRVFTGKPYPEAGSSFLRPEVSQNVLTGDQASEFATVASQKMTITTHTVNKWTEAGYIDLSAQDIDWTTPDAVSAVMDSFARVFASRLEARACAYLASTVSASAGWTGTNVSTIVSSVVDVVDNVFNAIYEMPDVLVLSLDQAIAISKIISTTETRTAISVLKEALSSILGINVDVVVGPRLAANTRVLGVKSYAESYLKQNGMVSVPQPDVLGQRIGISAYGALWAKPEAFIKLV